jgi:hypothetical protein
MRRVRASSADRGGVASVDLLQGLLGEADIRRRLEGSIGADAMEALEQVIHQVLSHSSRTDGGSSTNSGGSGIGTGLGGVLSDTVNRVLRRRCPAAASVGNHRRVLRPGRPR